MYFTTGLTILELSCVLTVLNVVYSYAKMKNELCSL